MLLDLKVSNFAIIDNVHISFGDGLNILSGETGAGKSVLLKSLALLMGEKALSDSVRSDARQATIEGAFDISERPDVIDKLTGMGVDDIDDQLIVRRVISKQGKSRIYLNGSLSTLNSLRSLVAPLIEFSDHKAIPLIEMTGQNDNRNLQSKHYHLDLLDTYANSWKLRTELSATFKKSSAIHREIESIESDSRNRAQRLDFLCYQRDEIDNMNLLPNEESTLEDKVHRLKNSSRLLKFAGESEHLLYSKESSIIDQLHRIINRGLELSSADPELEHKIKGLVHAKTLLEETAIEMREYEQTFIHSDDSLENCEDRLNQLRLLQKKYGTSVEEILSARDLIDKEINSLEGSDESLTALKATEEQLKLKLEQQDSKLHKIRTKAADLMTATMNDELLDLNMKGLIFKVELSSGDFTPFGSSSAEFVTRSTSTGKYRPIAKFASGGELSRILLAIKSIVGRSEHPRTFLFDEVDTGVSGETAEKVGRKLSSISKGQQVICVTHLPQVASFADSHFLIHKEPTATMVNMRVKELDSPERINEVARLLSGEKITTTSLEHAKQLLKESHP